jgi:3-methyladenine DNA glycosylase AlkD
MRQTHAEDKLAGILYLQEVLLPAGAIDWRQDLPRFAALFGEGHIFEWNTCDWFCVKVLGPLAEREGEPCARAISAWRTAANLWQRRASGVAFVNLAPRGDKNFPGFTDMLLETCDATVRHPERFAQTGTGWVLRELSRAEPQRVSDFIEAHVGHFSAEGLRQAIGKLSPEMQGHLRELHGGGR